MALKRFAGEGNPHQTASWIVLEEKIASRSRFLPRNIPWRFPNDYDRKCPLSGLKHLIDIFLLMLEADH